MHVHVCLHEGVCSFLSCSSGPASSCPSSPSRFCAAFLLVSFSGAINAVAVAPTLFSLFSRLFTRLILSSHLLLFRQDAQPPYPLHPTIAQRINEYAVFYNAHVIDKQPVHLQPVATSRATGSCLVPGTGPLLPVRRTADYAVRRVASTGPPLRVRCFSPDGPRPPAGWPALLCFHGGGWVLGSIETENVVATNICVRARCVVCVDYRLAPENPFSAAVDDAWEAALWLAGPGSALADVDIAKLAVGGSSAGANLAAGVCQRAAERTTWSLPSVSSASPPTASSTASSPSAPSIPAFQLQLLSVPVVENTADPSNNPSYAENEHAPTLPAAKMLWFRRHYLPRCGDWSNPRASPLLWPGPWSALPPAVILLGELDVMRHEGEPLGRKLAEAGVRADVHVLKGQPHSFLAMDGILEDGRRAISWFCDAMLDFMYGPPPYS